MTREILKWKKDKFNKVLKGIENGDEKHWILKSMGLGAVEGAVDGLVICGVMLLMIPVVIGISKIMNKEEA